MLNETNLINVESTKPTLASCGFYCRMVFLKAVNVERFFAQVPNFCSQVGEPCETVWTGREQKKDWFLVLNIVMSFSLKQSLTSFGDKSLKNWYSSVVRIWLFPWWTGTQLYIFIRPVASPLYIIRRHLSCNLFILLFNIHDNG